MRSRNINKNTCVSNYSNKSFPDFKFFSQMFIVAAAFYLNTPAPFANQTTVPHFLFIITILRLTKLILGNVICMYTYII